MTRFAADLLDSAAAEGARQSRSAKQQLDHWARVGCAVSSRHSAARRNVEDYENISPCFSASAAVAGISKLALAGDIDPSAVILVNLTGGDRLDTPPSRDVHWIERTASGWTADSPEALAARRDERSGILATRIHTP